jgi:hypothetical protein
MKTVTIAISPYSAGDNSLARTTVTTKDTTWAPIRSEYFQNRFEIIIDLEYSLFMVILTMSPYQ